MPQDLFKLHRSKSQAEQARSEIAPPSRPAEPDPGALEDTIGQKLRTIYDPEIPVNIVDLGLIYGVTRDGGQVTVRMTLTAPGCAMGDMLRAKVIERLRALPGIESVVVEVVFDPPWSQARMSDAAKLQLGLA
jgi:metal-sulfur cluster biosynthetic enzyme